MTKTYNENVLVIPSDLTEHLLDNVVPPDKFTMMDRNLAEIDKSYRQIIPYAFITDLYGNILVYRRTSKSGEGRLVDKLSIGFGGHINTMKYDPSGNFCLKTTIAQELEREISEEIDIANEDLINLHLAANNYELIERDDTPVDQVHVGIVNHLFYPRSLLKNGGVHSRETAIILEALPITKVINDTIMMSHMETWSRLILERF